MSSTPKLPQPLIHEGNSGISFSLFFLHNTLMNILQTLFSDHYEKILYLLHPRNVVIVNVDRMLHCGDPSFGGAIYGYPHRGNLKFVPGFFCVLHTFGRSLQWNSHIYCLITEGGFSDHGFWRVVSSLSLSSS